MLFAFSAKALLRIRSCDCLGRLGDRNSERLNRDLGGIRGLGRKQVGERGGIGQAGEDGFDDHRVFGVEIGAQGVGVSFAVEDTAYRGDEVRPTTLFHAGHNFVQSLAVFAILNGHDGAGNQTHVLPEFVPRAVEVHLSLAGNTEQFVNSYGFASKVEFNAFVLFV